MPIHVSIVSSDKLYSVLQLRWKIIFPFLAKSRAHAHSMRMSTRLCKEWQLQYTVGHSISRDEEMRNKK